jgi:hypothetical protein
MSCPETASDVGPDEALLILEPYFEVGQEAFASAGLPKVRRTRLYVAPWIHDSPRHFAACREDGLAALVAPELVELPEETVAAIIAHELGHAADFLYPGEFSLGREREALRRPREAYGEREWARWMRTWENRDDDTVEMTADAIVELAIGRRVGYLGPCQLQCFDRGRARPQGLR